MPERFNTLRESPKDAKYKLCVVQFKVPGAKNGGSDKARAPRLRTALPPLRLPANFHAPPNLSPGDDKFGIRHCFCAFATLRRQGPDGNRVDSTGLGGCSPTLVPFSALATGVDVA